MIDEQTKRKEMKKGGNVLTALSGGLVSPPFEYGQVLKHIMYQNCLENPKIIISWCELSPLRRYCTFFLKKNSSLLNHYWHENTFLAITLLLFDQLS